MTARVPFVTVKSSFKTSAAEKSSCLCLCFVLKTARNLSCSFLHVLGDSTHGHFYKYKWLTALWISSSLLLDCTNKLEMTIHRGYITAMLLCVGGAGLFHWSSSPTKAAMSNLLPDVISPYDEILGG